MPRLAFVLALLALDATVAAALAQSRARPDGSGLSTRQAERSYQRQIDAQRRLGLGAGGQAAPVVTAPGRSGSFNASGGYRAGSGTVTVPNR